MLTAARALTDVELLSVANVWKMERLVHRRAIQSEIPLSEDVLQVNLRLG